MIEKEFIDFLNDLSDNLYLLEDFFQKPKIFYRKFRVGKKLYKTRKMFFYDSIEDLMNLPTFFAIKTLKRRLNYEK